MAAPEQEPVPVPALTPERWVPALFRAWEQAGIPHLVLRNYDRLPAEPGNDLDVLVAPGQREKAAVLLRRCVGYLGGVTHHVAEFACLSVFFHDPATRRQFHVDIMDDLGWRPFAVLRADVVLAQRRDHRGLWVPAPHHEALLNLLTRLLHGGGIRARYRPQILAQAREEAFADALGGVLGGGLARRVLAWIAAGEWERVERHRAVCRLAVMRRACTRHPVAALRRALLDARRLVRRARRPPGLFLAMVGPDGCGKTSAGCSTRDTLAGTSTRPVGATGTGRLGLSPGARLPGGAPRTDPHGRSSARARRPCCSSRRTSRNWSCRTTSRFGPSCSVTGWWSSTATITTSSWTPGGTGLPVPEALVARVYRLIPKPGSHPLLRCAAGGAPGAQARGVLRREPPAARGVSSAGGGTSPHCRRRRDTVDGRGARGSGLARSGSHGCR